ncbi:CPBP family intramembrane glutamic endopeptidase [uncultured Limosilactobacillus sp.]|uniref:CPBP family intramembrane glutamic endopeptidase n=1 Tax=uncultured Limosilactobacillus sp. TaxID=2837629 RepID=UPI0026013DD5|nr:type II CAAX endopeptidase family protein [uncultured Limosilactobacillus sp.]
MKFRKARITQRQYDWLVMISYLSIFFLCSGLALPLGKVTSYIMSIAYTLLLIILGYINRKKLFTKISCRTVGMGILWGLIGVGIEMGSILLVLILHHVSIRSLNTTNILSLVKQLPAFIIYVVFVAPLLEELVFRQSMYERIKPWFDIHAASFNSKTRFTLAAVCVGFIFAMVHSDSTVFEYIMISVLLQVIYHHYKDIRVSMITHLTFNLATIICLLL